MSEQSIELDCAPAVFPRPGDLIAGVITGLDIPEKEPITKWFGNWKWDYSEIPAERWKEIQPILKERITALYEAGRIRYGSW